MRIFTATIMMLMTAVCGMAHGIEGLGQRILGDKAALVTFTLTPDSVERYQVSAADDGRIAISGSTPSALAMGLGQYLRTVCHTDVSWWAADPIVVPDVLPQPAEPLSGSALCPTRFFLNYCTYGYTMPYWKWTDWERLLDWMALEGVNAPLAIAGQEAVWQRVWRSFGLDDDTIRAYFSGPCYLPWHRMLNLDRWGGPLPQSYIDSQEALQKKIVERARSLGMRPVLPAFAGHVPPELAKVHPQVKIHPMSKWGGLDPERYRSYFIEPREALFDSIQSRFLAEQERTFGTDHIYGLDPFNEIEPPSWEPEYLQEASRRIYETLTAADPEAEWLQMAWMFWYMRRQWTPERVDAFLRGVPADKLILLDYYCDLHPLWCESNAFSGRRFIWSYLGNFGGNSFLVGNMGKVCERIDSVTAAGLPNFDGIGGTLEGLDVNRHMHSYALERAWKHSAASAAPQHWIESWAACRGADSDSTVARAWKQLERDIYRSVSTSQGSLVGARPCLEGYSSWTTNNRIKYDQDSLVAVWKMLIEADAKGAAHSYDIVNVGRQVLGNHFATLRDGFTASYKAQDVAAMRSAAARMQELITDLDRLLACSPAFSLDKWIADARAASPDGSEADYYESDARRLITTWTQTPGSLNDYANRDLAGLAAGYYGPRWRMFTDAVIAAAEQGKAFDGDIEGSFRRQLYDFEEAWSRDRLPYPHSPAADAKATATEICRRLGML